MDKIIILGCGLSGMLTALKYAKEGIKTTIIERNSQQEEFYSDIRTTALTPQTIQFLNSINIWDEVSQIAAEMLDVYVVDNKAKEMVHLSNQGKSLGYIAKNHELKKILIAHIKNNSFITLKDGCSYTKLESYADYSILYLDNDKLICDLVIVCDGSNSKARQYYFFNKLEKNYDQIALTFNIKHEKPHENCAIEHFMPTGPFAVLPLKDQYHSSIVWSTVTKQAPLLINLPKEELEYLIQNNIGNSIGKVTLDSEIQFFSLKARIANKYYHNRIVLVADSAHTIHPLAGQGLNQGIKDIDTLVQLSKSGITNKILNDYGKLRKDDNYVMYMITDFLNSGFSNYSEYLNYLRRAGLKVVDNLIPIKNLLIAYAMGKR